MNNKEKRNDCVDQIKGSQKPTQNALNAFRICTYAYALLWTLHMTNTAKDGREERRADVKEKTEQINMKSHLVWAFLHCARAHTAYRVKS